tara:strand:- start:814 stop:2019 length:1206 start_codon:yes stop_codon:yes gene_type:complete
MICRPFFSVAKLSTIALLSFAPESAYAGWPETSTFERQKLIAEGYTAARRADIDRRIAQARDNFQNTRIEITRDYLETVARNLKQAADVGRYFHKFRKLGTKGPVTPELARLLKNVRPLQEKLRTIDVGEAKWASHLSKAYGVIDAIRKDLKRSEKDQFTALSSHTLENTLKLGTNWLLESKKLHHLSFGATDIAVGIGGIIGRGHVHDPESVTTLLDGINKTAWGTLGLAVTKNAKAAALIADTADFAARAGRAITLPAFIRDNFRKSGKDLEIVSQYHQIMTGRRARNLEAQPIEEFLRGNKTALQNISPSMRQLANTRYGFGPTSVYRVTRTYHERYREICRGGMCTRTYLSRGPGPLPPKPATAAGERGGVSFGMKPARSGALSPDFVTDVLNRRSN